MPLPTDPLLTSQRHLGNHVIGLLDLNVRVVWNPLEGPDYTGASTHVFAIHNGFDDTHSDLASNYNFALDYDFETSVDDAFGSPTDSRGTAVAGIGAAANGTGAVAFNTNLVGYRTYGLSFDAGLPDASDAILPARSDELGVEVMTVSQSIPTDPLLNSQWHLGNPVIGLLDLNVRGVWNPLEGLAYTGASTRVFVIDNGVDYTHSDLAPNYNFALDFDFETNVNDAFGGPTDSHGTAVAGIIGAAANGTGAVGVAFNTNLVGYRTYGFISDAWLQDIRDAIFYAGSDERGGDVMNISQGIANDADSEFGVGYNAVRFDEIENSIRDAVGLGRGGLGTTIVKSAGNSRTDNYDVNADDWTNDTRQVVVAAVDQNGFVSWYSSYGAANLVSAFGTPGDVVTTDRVGADGYSNTDFTSSFNGTSAAAPMVTGVVALMYDANAGLGWRDVQSILAESARHVGSAVGGGITGAERYAWNWNAAGTWNGGGMHFSNDYGYGLVDALAAVRLSETWLLGGAVAKQTVNQFSNQMDVLNVSTIIPDGDSTGLTFFGNAGFDDIVERVTVEMTFSTTWTGDLEVYVTSPDGTVSQLIADTGASNDFNGTWTFETQAFRGERAAGTWSVRVVDDAGGDVLTVSDIVIRTFGEWSSNDRYVFTNEYSDYAGLSGHLTAVTDSNGGTDIVNASAVTTASIINLEGISTIDGVDVTFANIENVIGGDGSDSITGSDTDNVLYGMRGNDTINGGSGVDTVYGGDGNDTVDGGDGDDLIYLGTGDDYLNIVSSGDDTFWGSTGNDYIYGYVGNETYYGEDGNDTLLGHSGDDTLDGGEGEDSIEGGVGNDTIHGGSGVDTLYGGTGNDTLDGGLYEDSCYGDEGNDTFQVTAADFGDNVYGGADIDTLDLGGWTYSSIAFRVNLTTQIYEFLPNDYGIDGTYDAQSIENVIGSNFNDDFNGSEFGNNLDGGAGDDTIAGAAGDDTVYGGDGNDNVDGGDGDDLIYLGAGDDYLNIVSSGDDTFWGSTGNDYIYGYVGNETYYGEDGNDTLLGHSGDDTLDGGEGEDSIEGGVGNDTIHGGSGVDTLYGGTGNDTLDGGLYEDSCYGDEGNDTFQVTAADFGDNVYGGADIDTLDLGGWTYSSIAFRVNLTTQIYEFLPNDYGIDGTYDAQSIENVIGSNFNDDFNGSEFGNNLDGGAGDDTIAGAAGDDTVYGGDGNDNVDGGDGDDLIYLGAGDDYLNIVSSGDDTFWGSTGNDYIYGYVGNETYYGEDGNDTLLGHSGDDTLDGGEGEDSIEGGVGNDTIHGGSGVDTLYGGTGNDTLDGGLYEDSCYGDEGNDTFQVTAADFGDNVYGGADIDTLDLGGWTYSSIAFRVNLTTQIYEFLPNDYGIDGTYDAQSIENVIGSNFNDDFNGSEFGNNLDGGAGDDTIAGAAGDDTVYGGDGNDNVDGGDGDDLIYLGAGDDYLNIVSSGDDTFWGSTGNDYIFGYVGNETYYGEDGNDTLLGHSGDDTLDGGEGEDSLTGGSGNDNFVYASMGNGVDSISDFADGDRITIVGTTLILPITSGDGTALQQNQVQVSSASGVTTLHIGTDNLVGADVEIALAGELLPSQLRVSGSSILYNHAPNLASPTSADYFDSSGDDTFTAASGTFSGSDIDPDTTLSYGIAEGTVSSGVATKVGAYGTLSVNIGTGDYTFTPNDTAIEARKSNDSETFSVTVSDGSATANASFTVHVTGADDPTTFSGVATATVSEDGTITAAQTLTVSDRDTGDEAITPQSNTAGSYGAFSIEADGAWTYALNNAASAVQSLGIGQSLSDSFTAVTAGGATQVLTVTINGTNDAPTASHRTVTTNEDTARILAVADFGFSDVDTGDTLQAVTVTTLPAAGSLKLNGVAVTASQSISVADLYRRQTRLHAAANANGAGYASFGFKVSDGTALSDAAYTMTVNVTPVNDAPTASHRTVTINEDTARVLAVADFGFSDVDTGDTLQAVTVTTLPAAGSLKLNGVAVTASQSISVADLTAGKLVFTPAANANGAAYASFGFKVSDGTALSDAAYTMTVNVTPVNDAPTASHRTVTTNEDTARVLAVADFGFSDVDTGDTLQAVTVTTCRPLAASSSTASPSPPARASASPTSAPGISSSRRRRTPTAAATPASASRSATARRSRRPPTA
jgi:VCBS repeat-containing protein